MTSDNHEILKHSLDFLAACVSFASLAQILPAIASALSIVWLSVRLYEYFKHNRLKD